MDGQAQGEPRDPVAPSPVSPDGVPQQTRGELPLKRWSSAVGWTVLGVIIGAIVGRLFPPFVLDDAFWRSFLTSAGFGGVMAVGAALIAWWAAVHSAAMSKEQAIEDRAQRYRSDRKEQWWSRAEWALNLVVSDRPGLGFEVLYALGQSEWAEEHEFEVIDAALAAALDVSTPSDSGATMREGGTPE